MNLTFLHFFVYFPLSPFQIHLGFPRITRHMFITLLHNPPPPPMSIYTLQLLYNRLLYKAVTPSPLLHPSFQHLPVMFQADLSESLGNSSFCLVLAFIFHAGAVLPPLKSGCLFCQLLSRICNPAVF